MTTEILATSQGSIRRKLLLLATVSVGLPLLLACSMFAAYGTTTLRTTKWRQFQSQAGLLASNSAAAVQSADSVQGDRLLAALKADSSVKSAALYTREGTLVGSYPDRTDVESWFARSATLPAGHQRLSHPIKSDGQVIGELKLLVDFTNVQQSAQIRTSDTPRRRGVVDGRDLCGIPFATEHRRTDRSSGWHRAESGG